MGAELEKMQSKSYNDLQTVVGHDATMPVLFRFFLAENYRATWPATRTEVSLAGSFNNWSEEYEMYEYPEGSGWWGVVADLPQGVHQYKFCVRTLYPGDYAEKRWVHDADKRRVSDGFGGWNNEVEVTRALVEASRYINLDAMIPKGTKGEVRAEGGSKGFEIGWDGNVDVQMPQTTGDGNGLEMGTKGVAEPTKHDCPGAVSDTSAPENTPNQANQSTENPAKEPKNSTEPEMPPYERPILHPHAHNLIMKRQIQANYEHGKPLQYCFGVSNEDIAVLVTSTKYSHKYQNVIFYEDSNGKDTSEKKPLESELEFKMRGQNARYEKFMMQQEEMKKRQAEEKKARKERKNKESKASTSTEQPTQSTEEPKETTEEPKESTEEPQESTEEPQESKEEPKEPTEEPKEQTEPQE